MGLSVPPRGLSAQPPETCFQTLLPRGHLGRLLPPSGPEALHALYLSDSPTSALNMASLPLCVFPQRGRPEGPEAQGCSALLPGAMAEQGPKQPWAGALLLWIPLLLGQGRGPCSAGPTPRPSKARP